MKMTVEWIDVSVPLRNGMVHWPGDAAVNIAKVEDMENGDSHNLSRLAFSSHTGTHIDAPRHFIKEGISIDKIPLETFIGRARVIEIADSRTVTPAELERYNIKKGERILLKTKNSDLCWQSGSFCEDYVYITNEAACYLAQRKPTLVGVDYLSVGGYQKDGSEVHRTILEAGICIVEGLNLACVEAGYYEFSCLPLRLENGDGAPARAVLKKAA
jgi:arylformamidase